MYVHVCFAGGRGGGGLLPPSEPTAYRRFEGGAGKVGCLHRICLRLCHATPGAEISYVVGVVLQLDLASSFGHRLTGFRDENARYEPLLLLTCAQRPLDNAAFMHLAPRTRALGVCFRGTSARLRPGRALRATKGRFRVASLWWRYDEIVLAAAAAAARCFAKETRMQREKETGIAALACF